MSTTANLVKATFSGTDRLSDQRQQTIKVSGIVHPEYEANIGDWQQWRIGYEGGDDFIEKFLKRFSKRESYLEFKERKEITYLPAHAKSAINIVKNAIFQRLIEVKRDSTLESYNQAVMGENNGVDLRNSSMNAFIGKYILPELLALGKVGIYVDNRRFHNATKIEAVKSRPYIYWYKAEAIRSWRYDANNNLVALLLEDIYYTLDPKFGLPQEETKRYRYLQLVNNQVVVTFYDEEGLESEVEEGTSKITLQINRIPFVIFELTQSLMKDILMYQVALLNASSSDISYITKSNFPFYTEQYDPRLVDFIRGPSAAHEEGEESEAVVAKKENIQMGVTSGRRYPKGMDRPDFIHPSSAPIEASMAKQTQMKEEIRQMVDLSLSNIQMKSASAESKKEDKEGLQSGLSAIGLTLQTGEAEVASIWSQYETKEIKRINIYYPKSYGVKTDTQRISEAKDKKDLKSAVPSVSYQKEIAKAIVTDLFEFKISSDIIAKIMKEIDSSKIALSDVTDVIQSHKEGILDDEGAATALGFPDGTIEKAREDHAERIARIQVAQSQDNAQARGLDDLSANPKSGEEEKTLTLTSGKES